MYALKVDYIATELNGHTSNLITQYRFEDLDPERLSFGAYGYGTRPLDRVPLLVVLSITKVCRQIRAETGTLVYSLNPLRMEIDVLQWQHYGILYRFPDRLRPAVSSMIIDLDNWGVQKKSFQILYAVGNFEAVRKVTITWDRGSDIIRLWAVTIKETVNAWFQNDIEVVFKQRPPQLERPKCT